jgi:TnpA family transposase
MPRLQDTAYPRLKSSLTVRDLNAAFTPTPDELLLARRIARGAAAQLGFLVLLKLYQRLGRPMPLADAPRAIIEHVANAVGVSQAALVADAYDHSGTQQRHVAAIREHLRVLPYGPAARHAMIAALADAVSTKHEIEDLINVAIEQLVRQRFELPAFDTLNRAARRVRAAFTRALYRRVFDGLTPDDLARIDALFIVDLTTLRTPWNELKADAGNPTLSHLRNLVARQQWLAARVVGAAALADIPAVNVRHFAEEARALDAGRMQALEPRKWATLAAALLTTQAARALDDLGEMFVRRMQHIHNAARQALERYRAATVERTDGLVMTLHQLILAHQEDGSVEQRFWAMDALIMPRHDELLEACEAHLAHAGSNFYPFVWRAYRSHRATLFGLLDALPLRSTSRDTSVEQALRFLRAHAGRTGEWLSTTHTERIGPGQSRAVPLLDLSWVPDAWWRLLTDESRRDRFPERVHRRHFEACVFSQLMLELKAGDLCIVGSEAFADYREQLVSWDTYHEKVAGYGVSAGLPVESSAFVTHVRDWLDGIAEVTDEGFPDNKLVRIEDGEPIITRPLRGHDSASVRDLEARLAQHLPEQPILDLLVDTEHWLHWTSPLGPLSGHETKLEDAVIRQLATVFCYGTNMGPSQAARALGWLDRRQIEWINQHHVIEDGLDEANMIVLNGYNRFLMTRAWGSGKHVSADGTQWDTYERNLLAERHIRYGGFGGVAYYHVSDLYVALFSHFIPCGAYEGVYILDPFYMNKSDIQPDTVHADTHGQSAAIFGLAFILGIQLMPRIRNWKHLVLYRSAKETRYQHIDSLFTDVVDWDLIATHLPDMLRVGVSIAAGTITPSTILRRLGTYSRKNRLYLAFRELGVAVRTGFLLQFLGDAELRSTIQAATNKSESFNDFVKWLAFGGGGIIAENDRSEQRKIIKYNHLLANCLIFHNVCMMTRALHKLRAEGVPIEPETVAAISPYIRAHIGRFGQYTLDLSRTPPPIDYELPIFTNGISAPTISITE